MSDTLSRKENEANGTKKASSQAFGEEPNPSVIHRTSDEIYVGQKYSDSGKPSGKSETKKKESITKDIFILVAITLVAGCLLGAAHGVTKAPIAQAQADAKAKAQREVMENADHFETLYVLDQTGSAGDMTIPASVEEAVASASLATTTITQVDGAFDADGTLTGYVITADNPDGYGGNVTVMCGISPNADGGVTLEGISFLSLSETAGMGMRAREEWFINQFSGKTLNEGELLLYTKSGASRNNEIDAISGCTITTSAVTDDVNAALITAWKLSPDQKEDGK